MKCDNKTFKKFYALVEDKKITNKAAAQCCGYTSQYFSNLRKKYKEYGDRIFIHGHCGKPAYNAISKETKDFVINKYLEQFDEKTNPISFQYITDELNEEYNIKISYKTVYNTLKQAGINSPESHNVKRTAIKRIRFRRQYEGELVQWDATPYQWFKWAGDNSYYALHGALDDATSTFTGLYMCENECRYGYIECRRQTIERYGIEIEDYTDKAGIFCNNAKEKQKLSVSEQLSGKKYKTLDWERMNAELGVQHHHLANSPQSKGKIERAWETVQGRLPALFKKNQIATIEQANIFLKNVFIDYYATHFKKTPIRTKSMWRKPLSTKDLSNILCVKESRRVTKDGFISFEGLTFKVENMQKRGVIGEVCISERGIWFLLDGERYELKLIKDKYHSPSDSTPAVLENILNKYLYAECKEHIA